MKKLLLLIVAIVMTVSLVACGEKDEGTDKTPNPVSTPEVESNEGTSEEVVNVPKNEQTGTAGSNIPLKDNHDEAEYQIKVAMQDYLRETYGEKIFDARIYVEKIYTAEEEQEIEALKEKNLGADEVAFEVKYEIKPAEGVDPNEFTAATGEYDEESGWVKDRFILGILRPNTEESESKYIITDFGTGW